MPELIPLAAAVAPVRVRHCRLIDEAARWATERGTPIGADLFALICAGADRFDDAGGDPMLCWTRTGVYRLLRIGIPNWSTVNGCIWPVEVVPAAWHWLDFLYDTRRMDPASDPLWELRKPLICYGGLDFDGRPRPEDERSPIPCECHLPYREAAEYLGREAVRAEAGGRDLFASGPNPAYDGFDPATLGRQWTSDPPPARRARSRPGTARRRRPATKKR
ncbi:hypothetical protein [Pseudonocardia acaciae]|uniref:hypothetical protein n=1 Tax=Pseudonocardia acaciae TaxID=551276 RepID=UPI00048DA7FA|nr:hypothetical protein [Pseudonocardia acaciae]